MIRMLIRRLLPPSSAAKAVGALPTAGAATSRPTTAPQTRSFPSAAESLVASEDDADDPAPSPPLAVTPTLMKLLEGQRHRAAEVRALLSNPDTPQRDIAALAREAGVLSDLVTRLNERERLIAERAGLAASLEPGGEAAGRGCVDGDGGGDNDDDEDDAAELRALARADLASVERRLQEAETSLVFSLVDSDPLDRRGAILEVRAAVGGDEACAFAGEVWAMHRALCRSEGLRFDEVECAPGGPKGGIRSAVAEVSARPGGGLGGYGRARGGAKGAEGRRRGWR